MSDNEFSIAASYYNLFVSNAAGRKEIIDNEETIIAAPKASSSSANNYWIDDVWTEKEERDAKRILDDNLEKCAISTMNTVRGGNYSDGEAWDKFYKDHGTRFFKDRHYFSKAFPDEFGTEVANNDKNNNNNNKKKKTLIEFGCGVGNALLPLLEDEDSVWTTIHGLDISSQAIDLLQKDRRYVEANKRQSHSVYGHVCDISMNLPSVCENQADVSTLLFCLSAIDPSNMVRAVQNVASSLQPGGVLVFRDYGRYDEAQLKLGTSRNKLIKDNFYRKHDGTKCYYFTLEDVNKLFHDAGLIVLELKYLRRVYENHATDTRRRRVWVQGRFKKPGEVD